MLLANHTVPYLFTVTIVQQTETLACHVLNLPPLSLINLKMPSSEQASIKLTWIRGSSIVVCFFVFFYCKRTPCMCLYTLLIISRFLFWGLQVIGACCFRQTSGLEWGHSVIYLSLPGLENLTHCTFSSQKQVLSFICSFAHDVQYNISAFFSSVSHGKVIFFLLL